MLLEYYDCKFYLQNLPENCNCNLYLYILLQNCTWSFDLQIEKVNLYSKLVLLILIANCCTCNFACNCTFCKFYLKIIIVHCTLKCP